MVATTESQLTENSKKGEGEDVWEKGNLPIWSDVGGGEAEWEWMSPRDSRLLRVTECAPDD